MSEVNKTNPNDLASGFEYVETNTWNDGRSPISTHSKVTKQGLSKREHFAAMALQGLMVQAIAGSHNCNNDTWNRERAMHAVAQADALIEALNKDTKE